MVHIAKPVSYSQTWTFFEGKWHDGNAPIMGPRTHAAWLGSVVFDVYRRRGSIFLADSVNACRIAVGRDILFENFRFEGTMPEGVIKHGTRSA